MNNQIIKQIVALVSPSLEIKIILATLLIVICIPVLTVLILTQAGINLVSDALATQDVQTSQVNIHDPLTGKIIGQINESRIWPIDGIVTLEFGQSDLPYQMLHTGIDIASPGRKIGDPVHAFMQGKVIFAGGNPTWGFGNYVEIDHGHGITSIYGHLNTILVSVGQKVTIDTVIGTRGTTGWSTGPHLHFQINIFGIPVNPRIFLSGNP